MNKKIKYHLQSVLVPIDKFKTTQEAAKYVDSLGYKSDFKPPHLTDNYIRFRQYNPKPGENFRTENLDSNGTKAIVSVPKNHLVGANGHGIWKPEFQTKRADDLSIYHPNNYGKKIFQRPAHEHHYQIPVDGKRVHEIHKKYLAEKKQLLQIQKKA